jgi:hypothetical protein
VTTSYTTESGPPPSKQRTRFSLWNELFAECREHPEEWRRTLNPLSRSTAAQLASDIRNAYRRDLGKSRVRGMLPGERWDAAWGEINGQYFIWLKYLGQNN